MSLVGLGLAVIARQWLWCLAIVVGVLIIFVLFKLSHPTELIGPLGSVTAALVLCAPLYPCLAYGLWRIVFPHEWPVKPA